MSKADNNIRVKIQINGQAKTIQRPAAEVKALKPAGEYKGMTLRVLGVPFGGHIQGRDSDGEAFHDLTDIWLNKGDSVPATYLHGYGPDDPDEWQNPPVIIGRATYIGVDKRGHWFEVTLDESEELAQRVADATKTDSAKASSGAIGHIVRPGEAGLIDVWPVGELAVFDTNEWRQPANQLAVVEAKIEDAEEPEGLTPPVEVVSSDADTHNANNPTIPTQGDTKKMSDEKEVQPTIEPTQVNVTMPEFDYSKMAEAMKPMIDETVKSKIDAALENAAPITAKGAPAHMKHAHLGSDLEEVDEIKYYLKTGYVPSNRKPNSDEWSSHPGAKAAMQEGTAAEGGYLVPDDFYARIIEKRDEMSIARRAGAEVIPTSLKVVNVPIEDTKGSWDITAEEGAYNESEPTLNQVAITVYKHTRLVKLSMELIEDQAANLDSFLSSNIGRTLALHENEQFLVGTGSSECQGAYVGGTAGLTFDYATTIGAQEIPELMYKLKGEYFDGASWHMRSQSFGYLAGLRGDPFMFQATPAANGVGPSPRSLEGYPVFFSAYNAAMTSGLKPMLFGNWAYYGIAERTGMVIQRNPFLYMANDQMGLFARIRFGGAVKQAEAFQYGTMA